MPAYVVKKSVSLREQVVDAVLHDLQSGVFTPGERVTEEGLARRLNVSRTPIREALSQLSHQGTLAVREGGGFVVPLPTADEVRDIHATRMLLEPAAVRMAAIEFSAAQVEAITRALEREAAAANVRNPARFARANEEFRAAIFQFIANKALSRAIAQFDNHLHFIRSSTLTSFDLRHDLVKRQTEIRDAIAAHDAELAGKHWVSYLAFSESCLIAALAKWAAADRPKRPRTLKAADA